MAAEPRTAAPARAGVAAVEVAAVTAAVAALAARASGAREWSGGDRHRVLADLDRAVDALSAVRAAVLVAERDAGTWAGAGDRTLEAWRARTSRSGHRAAAAQVRQAEGLAAVPAAAVAVAEGRIGLEQATVIGRVAAAGTPVQREAATSPDGQRHLLALAERLDAGALATAVARWAAELDPAALERDHESQRAQRFLSISATPHGTFLKGRLHSTAGHRLTLALEALSPRPGAEDERDPGQRRADALDAMAARILAATDTKPGGHVPPQITMVLSEATWVAARAERDRRREAGGAGAPGPSRHDERGVAGYAPATLEDGTPVPVSELAAAMCDCELTRLVIDAEGVPLDVGRAQRVFTGPQRRAVIARDRECAWPQCPAHARWCEVHHIRWWERDGGPTSVENGVLLCSYHHHEVHRLDLAITRVVTGVGGPSPGAAPPGGRARGASSRVEGGPPAGAEGGAPGVDAAASPLSRVGYEIRHRAGRLVGGGAPVPARPPGWSPARPAAVGATEATVTRGTATQGTATGGTATGGTATEQPGATGAASGVPAQRGGAGERTADGARRDGGVGGIGPPPLEWADDPVTGMRVPAYFLEP